MSTDDLRSALAAGTKRPWALDGYQRQIVHWIHNAEMGYPTSFKPVVYEYAAEPDARLIVAAVNNAEALLDKSDLHDHVVRRLEMLHCKLYGEGATGLLHELADIIYAARSKP